MKNNISWSSELRTRARALAALLALTAILFVLPRHAESDTTISGDVTVAYGLEVGGSISKGSGSFVIDHPLRPRTMLLYHSFVESPDAKNVYAGTAVLDENGRARITLPEYFEALNADTRYQFFPLTDPMPNLFLAARIENNSFSVGGGIPGGKISWMVTGVRQDAFIKAFPIQVEVEKGPDTVVQRGECLFEPLCRD
jgi:hypothetical protein